MTKRSSLVDQVVDQILELIQSDQLEVGKKLLSERELMQICGAGRSTVREALRLLQAQGYVELRPNAGAYLSSKQPDNQRALSWIAEHSNEMRDVLEVRLALEGVAARMAAQRATDQEIYLLVGIQTMMEKAASDNDYMRLALHDAAFHEAIAKATHFPLIVSLNEQMAAACANFRGKTFIANKGFLACEAHKQIIEAIQAHDGQRAQRCMEAHMQANIEMAASNGI